MLLKNLVLGALFSVAFAAQEFTGLVIYTEDELSVNACENLIEYTALLVSEYDPVGYCNVHKQQALGTMVHSLKQSPHKKASQTFLEGCKKYNLTQSDMDKAYKNATKYMVSNPSSDPNFNATTPYYKPISFTDKQVKNALLSTNYRYQNYNWSAWFGTALIAYWFFIILVASIVNFLYFTCPTLIKSLKGKAVNFFRKYLTLPPLGKSHHAHHLTFLKVFQGTIPLRFETLLIAGWLVMALAFCISHIRHVTPDVIFTTKASEIGRKLADRTGIMALFLMPELVLFAGRNNFLQWISGWPYARFNLLHRWISRITVLFVLIHGVGMWLNGKGEGRFEQHNAEPFVRWGYVALVAGCILAFHSLLIIRRSNYEVFLLIHILMAIFFMVGAWKHTVIQGYGQWSYAACAIWAFDRVVRLGRLFAFGVRTASVQLISNETLKVTVKRPHYWKPFPGCHTFIHFLRPTCFWQSHPFTIVQSFTEADTIIFYVKVKGGMTHGLCKYLSKQPDCRGNIKVSVEGPYGHRLPVRHFDNSVFIAGGNGIPGLYSDVVDICKSQGQQKVKLFWIIRHYQSINWFYHELRQLKDTAVDVVIYVTQPLVVLDTSRKPYDTSDSGSGSLEVDADDSDEKKADSEEDLSSGDYAAKIQEDLSFIEFRHGRPSVSEVIESEINQANSSIAFVTCAHADMVDKARKTIANNLSTEKRVELFESLQTW